MRLALALTALLAAPAAHAADTEAVVARHVLPGYERLAAETAALATTAEVHCAGTDPALRDAWAAAFDAWIRVSHLRFGPSETGDRAFALAFWPDSRGATPAALGALIDAGDPVVATPEDFATVSIAARGFYALEFLLYDPAFLDRGEAGYRCALVQAIARDTAAIAADILSDWQDGHAQAMIAPSDPYRTEAEAQADLYEAAAFGLQFTSDTRLGRPMGTLDRPRPTRAEARRSARSLRHVVLSLEATRDLALLLADGQPEVGATLDAAWQAALASVAAMQDDPGFAPDFSGADDPMQRFRMEALQDQIDTIRNILARDLAPVLGITAGFNAMDGD